MAGHVTPQGVEEFERTTKKCLGYSYVTNMSAVAADAPDRTLCFGWLVQKNKQ